MDREENDAFIRLCAESSMMASLVYICDKMKNIAIHFGRFFAEEWAPVVSANTLKFGAHSLQFIVAFSGVLYCLVSLVRGVGISLPYLVTESYGLPYLYSVETTHLYLFFWVMQCVWRDEEDTPLFLKTRKCPWGEELNCLIYAVRPVLCVALNSINW